MSSTIITCQSCGTKNRIPVDRIGQRMKCGSCGKVLAGAGSEGDSCSLCQSSASDGVMLSNGRIVHEACLKTLQDRQAEIEAEVNEKQWEIGRIQQEIKQQSGLAFKLKSLFSKPQFEADELINSMAELRSDVDDLLASLSNTKNTLSPIYDYFLSYPPDWDKRRESLINKKGEFCSKCGSTSHLHVHHIKPLSKGGSNELTNLTLLCEACHSAEHGGRDFSGEFSPSETAFSKRVVDIRYAVSEGKRISFGYRKPTEEGFKQRTVRPVELVSVDHYRDSGTTLCVKGYCELRKAERIFALKRMRGLKVI